MVSVNDKGILNNYLARIFFYGFKNEYSYSFIEYQTTNSEMISSLEKNDNRFLYRKNFVELIEDIYGEEQIKQEDAISTNSMTEWLAEAYLRLFYKYNKCFEYLFLYVPLEVMVNLFDIYHEMDWNQLYSYFEFKVKEKSLLNTLILKNKISKTKLSVLSGISLSTINYYCLNDKNIYEAKYQNIYSLATALDVNPLVFASQINNFLDSNDYSFDRNDALYRNYLGLNIVSYYSEKIFSRKYKYSTNQNRFISDEGFLKVLWTNPNTPIGEDSSKRNNEIVELLETYDKTKSIKNDNNKTMMVIFEYNQNSNGVTEYKGLLAKYNFESIYIINSHYLLCIKKSSWITYLPSEVYNKIVNETKTQLLNNK